jgi:hypothetical protein
MGRFDALTEIEEKPVKPQKVVSSPILKKTVEEQQSSLPANQQTNYPVSQQVGIPANQQTARIKPANQLTNKPVCWQTSKPAMLPYRLRRRRNIPPTYERRVFLIFRSQQHEHEKKTMNCCRR